MSDLSFEDIPSNEETSSKSKPSRVRKQLIRSQLSRRGVIVGGLTGASVAAFTSYEAFIAKIPAFADTAPFWGTCAQYRDAALVEYGPGYSTTWWSECNPLAQQHSGNVGDDGQINIQDITQAYCNSDGYHRTDNVYVPSSGNTRKYNRRPNSCAGKNAWVWRVDKEQAAPNKRSRRCSDGKVEIVGPSGQHLNWFNTVCEERLPQHNPSGVPLTDDVY